MSSSTEQVSLFFPTEAQHEKAKSNKGVDKPIIAFRSGQSASRRVVSIVAYRVHFEVASL